MRHYFIVPLLAFLLFSVSPAFAETKIFIKEYTYQAGDEDSKNSSRTIALREVKRLLQEELGIYLVSETEVKDMRLTKDQVTTYSAGIVSAEIIDEKWDGKAYWLKARISADPKEVEKALRKLVLDKSKLKELEETRKKAEELTKENERLRKELEAMAKAKNRDTEAEAKNVEAYKKTITGLNAVEWFERGSEALIGERWKEALYAFTKAIKLEPDYAEAYNNRGATYHILGNYQQEIKDLNKAIKLKPDLVEAYFNRGTAYDMLGIYGRAIQDFHKAIELKPDYARAYLNRGIVYSWLGNYQQATEDYNKAIELKPDYAYAYSNRGDAYKKLGNYEQAIKDYKIAARLGDKDSQEFLKGEGLGW